MLCKLQKELHLMSKRVQVYKDDHALCAVLEITGPKKNADMLNLQLLEMKNIKDFH